MRLSANKVESVPYRRSMADGKFEEIAETFEFLNNEVEDLKSEFEQQNEIVAAQLEDMSKKGFGKSNKSRFMSGFSMKNITKSRFFGLCPYTLPASLRWVIS